MAEHILWQPQPKQARALACPAFELLYGGAAGGGKSDFLLADFLSGVNEWGHNWRGILFRKTYTELGELLRRARELYLPLGAEYQVGERRFTFPGGAELELRYLETETDVERYQGHQYTWVG
ncbi:MAG: terminase, partial [Treponema sp.]|nr:terminase [Treponema sp.]